MNERLGRFTTDADVALLDDALAALWAAAGRSQRPRLVVADVHTLIAGVDEAVPSLRLEPDLRNRSQS